MAEINWQSRLDQIAAEHPDAPGKAGEILRERLKRRATYQFTNDLQVAHGRAREAVATGARMSLRCGALLLNVPPGDLATVLSVVGMSPQAAEQYMHLALDHPEMSRRCLRRNGRITECEALESLRGGHTDGQAHPLADLRALLQLHDEVKS